MLAICECGVLRISRGLPFSLILQVPKKSYTMVLGKGEEREFGALSRNENSFTVYSFPFLNVKLRFGPPTQLPPTR